MSWRHQRRETITRLVTVKSFQVIFVAGPGILKSGGRGKRHTSSREPIKKKLQQTKNCSKPMSRMLQIWRAKSVTRCVMTENIKGATDEREAERE